VARRTAMKDGPRLAESLRPADNGEAFAIQAEVSRLLAAQTGDPIGGWKCLLPSPGKLVVGPIFGSKIYRHSPCPVLALKGVAVIEPEFAFVMSKTLPPKPIPYTEAQIMAATGETRLALELIKSRFSDPAECEFPELLADGLFNQGLYLGPAIEVPAPAALKIRLKAGEQEKELAGLHPNGNAYAPLVWLANFLRQQGMPLLEDQIVITGSYAGVLEVPFSQEIEVGFADLGTILVSFVEVTGIGAA